MSIVAATFKELFGMFLGDVRLSGATLLLVTIVGGLAVGLHVGPLLAGGVLLFGCLAILVGAVAREARGQVRR